jgi:hypothetical protein
MEKKTRRKAGFFVGAPTVAPGGDKKPAKISPAAIFAWTWKTRLKPAIPALEV